MVDARKEFQVFMSPTRNSYRDGSVLGSKHRLVPVINRFLSSSSSNFVTNQRKSSVYQAVSGVSFQETDVYDEISSAKKQKKHSLGRMRRESCSPGTNADKILTDVKDIQGTRRSKSLTNMKAEYSNVDDLENTPLHEITHPCTPVVIYTQPRGRQSRYAKVRERKRASSQARPNLEHLQNDSPYSSANKEEQPVRPRRTRSASRTRKLAVIQSFSSESSLNDVDLLKSELSRICDDNNYMIPPSKRESKEKSVVGNDMDFSVNDTDWRKYDVMVTEKLNNLLKSKEEPEGGYFSLERDEIENIDAENFIGEAYQQDNSSETIYVTPVFKQNNELNGFNEQISFTSSLELPELELADYGTVKEINYPEDEGLYEEIFLGQNEKPQNEQIYQYGVNENLHQPDTDFINKRETFHLPIIETKENSTIVYIRCNDLPKYESSMKASYEDAKETKSTEKCNYVTKIGNNSCFKASQSQPEAVPKRQIDTRLHAGWCGCRKNSHFDQLSVSHSSSCIQSKSGALAAKYSHLIDKGCVSSDEDTDVPKVERKRRPRRQRPSKQCKVTTPKVSKSSSAVNIRLNNFETRVPETELSDLDFDMFAPKFRYSRMRKDNIFSSNRSCHYRKHRDYRPSHGLSIPPESKTEDITSPNTFKAFLANRIFNPPNPEVSTDATEPFVIREDQIVTCITDSSSSDESDNADPLNSSPWLEAKGDFEFVAFKKDKKNILPTKRRKRKLLPLPKMFSNPPTVSHTTDKGKGKSEQLQGEESGPERPSRTRRKKTPNGGERS